MYIKIILFTIVIAFQFQTFACADELKNLKAAFTRDNNLWTYINNEEKQITDTGKVIATPQWSHDGKWLLYQLEAPSEHNSNKMQTEIWVYNVDSNEKIRIFYDGYNPQWAPKKNIIAFQDHGGLNISDFTRFYNVALGVHGYTWLPDGSGFLMASQANLLPDGWTNPILYKKKLQDNFKNILLFNDVQHFFTIPKELSIDQQTVMSINVSDFSFSPSNKWISFIVSPTASMSMDSNMLAVISKDGRSFEPLGEVIFGVGSPKWAPTKDIIAYIEGSGRIVFGFKNKNLNIKEMPASGSFTPNDFAELDFTWTSDQSIVTSRVKETEWSNDFSKHPLPSLYKVDIHTGTQKRITTPPSDFGDYNPKYNRTAKKLIWFRGKSITDDNRNVWISDKDGTNSQKWLKNVDAIEFFEAN